MIRPEELIALRAGGQSRSFAASELPSSVAVAYDVAAATLGLLGSDPAGWKLGATTAATRRIFATDEVYYGALLADEIWDSTLATEPPVPPVLRGEAEIALRLAVDIRYDQSEAALESSAMELFDAWAPAIEAPYSCVREIAELGLRALLMDRCAAGALYLGEPRSNVEDPAMEQAIEITVDGVSVAEGAAHASLLMTPREAARRFLRVAAEQGVSVRRGQWISTGGITACVMLPLGKPIQLSLGGKQIFNLIAQARAT
jgi:2-keto-4-pentenoate hydratase